METVNVDKDDYTLNENYLTKIKTVKVVKDSVTFTLNEADLTKRRIGEGLKTPKRHIPYSYGQWWINYSPAGSKLAHLGNLSVYFCVNQDVKAKYTFAIDGSRFDKSYIREFFDQDVTGYHKYASHPFLRRYFRDGKLIIICNVEFFIDVDFDHCPPKLIPYCKNDSTDFDLLIGGKRLHVNKRVLSLISPVFHAMLTHDTAESRSEEVVITDFDFNTVKAAIDYCYGRNIKNSVNMYIHILRFADKYDIKDVVSQLEYIPMSKFNLSLKTFHSIVLYAYDYSKDNLLTNCCTYFKFNQVEIKATEKFAELPPRLIARLLQAGEGKRNNFRFLDYAYSLGKISLVENAERPLLEFMTLGDFYLAVIMAWQHRRDQLKKACGIFFYNNMDKILSSKYNAFYPELLPNPKLVTREEPPRCRRNLGKKRLRSTSDSRVGSKTPPNNIVKATVELMLPYKMFHTLLKLGQDSK